MCCSQDCWKVGLYDSGVSSKYANSFRANVQSRQIRGNRGRDWRCDWWRDQSERCEYWCRYRWSRGRDSRRKTRFRQHARRPNNRVNVILDGEFPHPPSLCYCMPYIGCHLYCAGWYDTLYTRSSRLPSADSVFRARSEHVSITVRSCVVQTACYESVGGLGSDL